MGGLCESGGEGGTGKELKGNTPAGSMAGRRGGGANRSASCTTVEKSSLPEKPKRTRKPKSYLGTRLSKKREDKEKEDRKGSWSLSTKACETNLCGDFGGTDCKGNFGNEPVTRAPRKVNPSKLTDGGSMMK